MEYLQGDVGFNPQDKYVIMQKVEEFKDAAQDTWGKDKEVGH